VPEIKVALNRWWTELDKEGAVPVGIRVVKKELVHYFFSSIAGCL